MSQLVAVDPVSCLDEMVQRHRSARARLWPAPRFAARTVKLEWPPSALVAKVQAALSAPAEPTPPPEPPVPDPLVVEVAAIAALTKRIKVADIVRAVAAHYRVREADILSQRRTRSIVRPRQVAMFLARELTPRSLPEIGRLIGGRDHTTVLHGVSKIGSLIEAGDPIKGVVDAVRARLLA